MSIKISRRTVLAATAASAALATLPVRAQSSTLHEISIKNFKFIPNELEVRPGDRIRWTNSDSAPHDATALDGDWKTSVVRRGQATEITVIADMSGSYMCSIHPRMRASITVV